MVFEVVVMRFDSWSGEEILFEVGVKMMMELNANHELKIRV